MSDDFLSIKFGYKGRVYDNPQDGVQALIKDLQASFTTMPQNLKPVLFDYLTQVAQALAKRHGGSSTGPDRLAKRSGEGVKSILKSVKVTGTTWANLRGSIGGLQRLAIHEFGGTIRAKGKLLTIPLPAALGKRGVPPPFARQWKNTFVAETKAGHLLIFQRRAGGIVPLYILVDQITIPARLGMRKELQRQIPYFLDRAVNTVVAEFEQQLGAK